MKAFWRWLKGLFATTTLSPEEVIDTALWRLHVANLPPPKFPITLVDKPPSNTRVQRPSPNAEGWTYVGNDRIFIPTYSDVFRRALEGDNLAIIKLASVLVHEDAHLRHPLDERLAYDAQLDALRTLGAPVDVVEAVMLARRLRA